MQGAGGKDGLQCKHRQLQAASEDAIGRWQQWLQRDRETRGRRVEVMKPR